MNAEVSCRSRNCIQQAGCQQLETSDLYPNIALANDLSGLNERIREVVYQLGLSDYWFLPLHRVGQGMGRVSSFPGSFFLNYEQAGLCEHDLLLDYAREQCQPLYLSILHDYLLAAPVDCSRLRQMKEVYALYGQYGIHDAYCVFVKKRGLSSGGLFAVTCRGMAPVDFKLLMRDKLSSVQLLADTIEHVGCARGFEYFLPDVMPTTPEITPQPLRVLAALANDDVTIAKLADKLCISPITAHQHITAARKALGVRTNIGAIRKAMQLGLIEFENPGQGESG